MDTPKESQIASSFIHNIDEAEWALMERFAKRLVVQSALSRSLVSFQANKARPMYRWYKYKEAFSASLVSYFLHRYNLKQGVILDPFAGIGTTLSVAAESGIEAHGIELLPIGQEVIQARQILENRLTHDLVEILCYWRDYMPWKDIDTSISLRKLRITDGAYPQATQQSIERYIACLQREHPQAQTILRFALLCILENISFTRKDGQYLRWDYRSGRKQGKKAFNKGRIIAFDEAIISKLTEIIDDIGIAPRQLELFPTQTQKSNVHLLNGSCFDWLPTLAADNYDAVITSPPYLNRYDYTRTYALELALLGVGEEQLTQLRQAMLSCTVENRPKQLEQINPSWQPVIKIAEEHSLLQAILSYLETQKESGELNNAGIPRMVRGYFYEMACVIFELGRVMKSGAPLIMVNDNVRYAGVPIAVDLILADFAEQLGFAVETIWVLPNEKGNSSQQMGAHGRESLRKCVYVSRKL